MDLGTEPVNDFKTVPLAIYCTTFLESPSVMRGRTLTYAYDSNSNLVSVTNPAGDSAYYIYDLNNRLVSITDKKGITTVVNEYDANGRVSKQTLADGGVFTFEYAIAGGEVAQTKVANPNGNTSTRRFRNYYAMSRTNPYGQTTYYDRDYATNQLMSVTDPLGRVTRYTYDQNGNRTSIVDPAGNTTIIEYDQTWNKPIKITDALGHTREMRYDSKGNLISITDPSGNTTTINYNKYGQPVSVTNALGDIATFEYDEYENRIKITDPLGNSTTMQYDVLSRVIARTDPKGRTMKYSHDWKGRITEVTDALNGKTKFTYDPVGKLLSVTDAKNQTISYTYNVKGKIESMTDQLGRVERYEYDLNDNLVSMTDQKDQTTNYTYDKKNRVVRVDYADGSYTTYTYDNSGKLTYMYDLVSGPIEYIYSNGGCAACGGRAVDKVIQEITPLGSISYEYDALGRRTEMQVAGQEPVTYSYDSNSRLTDINTTINGVAVPIFSGRYDNLGRRTGITLPNGVTTNYTYDNASRFLNLDHLNPMNQVLESLSYTYDANGNRTSMQRINTPVKLPEPASNITHDQANEMLTFKPSASSMENMTYDANGNMTAVTNSCGTTNYTWDVRNRLIGINGFTSTCTSLTASFEYDALGRRIEKTINGRTIQYLYDGLDIVQEIENGQATVNYIRTLKIDEPLARIKADGTVRYYQQDALGSVIALTDETGTVKTQYSYDPFGNTTISGEVSDNPFQYTGRENDGIGLYYYRARYYSPELQRFISEDPIGLAGGINKFVYTKNNPIRFTDPFGQNQCESFCHMVLVFIPFVGEILVPVCDWICPTETGLDPGECTLVGSSTNQTNTVCTYRCDDGSTMIYVRDKCDKCEPTFQK